jgi:hypothetical protein
VSVFVDDCLLLRSSSAPCSFAVLHSLLAPVGQAAGKKDAPLPKAISQDAQTDLAKKLPPFFGLFGTTEFIAKMGFRSKVGRFIEYQIEPKGQASPPNQSLRIAEVGPEVKGARWIEITAQSQGLEGQGLRILTRGEKEGNIERLIVRAGGMPAMEFPLESMGLEGGSGAFTMTNEMLGEAKHLGKETITVPIGQFVTDHWLIEGKQKKKLELWVTAEDRVPFVGIVKMTTDQGFAVASKVGTEAVAAIPVPPREN